MKEQNFRSLAYLLAEIVHIAYGDARKDVQSLQGQEAIAYICSSLLVHYTNEGKGRLVWRSQSLEQLQIHTNMSFNQRLGLAEQLVKDWGGETPADEVSIQAADTGHAVDIGLTNPFKPEPDKLTMRDEFALRVVPTFAKHASENHGTFKDVARKSYLVAEAMLQVRTAGEVV